VHVKPELKFSEYDIAFACVTQQIIIARRRNFDKRSLLGLHGHLKGLYVCDICDQTGIVVIRGLIPAGIFVVESMRCFDKKNVPVWKLLFQ